MNKDEIIKAYSEFANEIDDYFEYRIFNETPEFLKDREKVKELLTKLANKLKTLDNRQEN